MSSNSSIWVPVIVAFLAGFVPGLTLYFTRKDAGAVRRREKEKAELDHDQRVVELVINEVARQRDSYKDRVVTLEHQVESLKLEIQGLKLMQGRDPFPRWMVDRNGSLMYVNSCFEERFLLPRGLSARDIIGKTHEDSGLWSESLLSKLGALNELAKQRPDGRAKATISESGMVMTVYKIAVRHSSGAILGYEGWITYIEPIDEGTGQ